MPIHLPALSLFILITAILAACTRAPETMPETSPDIWVKAFNAGDIQALASVYTENCVLMPPNATSAQGRQGVKAAFHFQLREGFQIGMSTGETEVRGDVAYRRGAYEYKDRHGASTEQGKYLQIWRKFDKVWLLSRHIWNADVRPNIQAPQFIQ
jgi:ketosteroid isomerase-like protein